MPVDIKTYNDLADQNKIAVIVPAYNEAGRIENVLRALTSVNHSEEIIVVDDGSKDDTFQRASTFQVKVIRHEKNRGKGAAMQTGLDAASPEINIFLFIDADLVGLAEDHIRDLVYPLMVDPDLDMTFGKFTDGRKATDLAQKIVPNITGQRAITKRYKDKLPDLSSSRFAVEVILTNTAKELGLKFLPVPMQNVTHVMKEEKYGIVGGFLHRLKMYYEMAVHR